ncbi:MAG: ATP-binding protein [candidate division KSB1 bacterium]|nr:ATP-binding protein [candidate division KSB1 bacterium]
MFKSVIKEQLKVPAHIDYLGELRDFVVRVGRKYGVSEKIINSFKLAIDEAGTNIIRHAYRDHDEPGFILLRVIVRKASITVSLIDQGKYFDPRNVGSPDLKRYVDIGKKGGLGIFIIRKLMDEIDYRRTEEGNELRLTKYRTDEIKKGVKALPEKSQGDSAFSQGQIFHSHCPCRHPGGGWCIFPVLLPGCGSGPEQLSPETHGNRSSGHQGVDSGATLFPIGEFTPSLYECVEPISKVRRRHL